MNVKLIRITSLLLLLATLIGCLPLAASAQPTYSSASNSGKRDQICTSLTGTGAVDYYDGGYEYDRLSQLSQSALYAQLAELMTDSHKTITSYGNCRDYAPKTDSEGNNGRITLIYTSYSAAMSDYQGGNGWNREHIWPKSLGGFNQDGAGADLHHIRPSDNRVNSTRGNKLYGNVNGGSNATGGSLVGSSTVGGTYAGNYFEPLDNVKGDVARICLYVYVRWAAEYPKCKTITNVFKDIDTLLEWCALDPVDTWEMGRNEVVESIQGNRNVFIDYPEYAWLIFGREVPSDLTTPSGEAQSDNSGGTTTPVCQHKHTEVQNASPATCGKAGYSGDTYCTDCDKMIVRGQNLPATGNHTFGAWITAADGSQSRTCSVCQKVEQIAAEGCKHPTTELRGASPVTCGKEGYSGDVHCAECGQKMSSGTVLPPTGNHTFENWITAADGSKSRTCMLCGYTETKEAEQAPAENCPHTQTERRGMKEANCADGYTGDTYCTDCGALVGDGTVIPAMDEHTYGAAQPIEGTDLVRQVCSTCGHELVDMAKPAPKESTNLTGVIAIACASGTLAVAAVLIALLLIKKRK